MKTNERTNKNLDAKQLNLSIIPVSSQKIPFKPWTQFQKKITPIDYWYSHYKNEGTIGIITGKISGNLEIIDVDIKNDSKATIMTEYSELIPDELLKRLLIQTTPNNGFHLIYRCPDAEIEANQKLALDVTGEVIIETRGEGGYFCTSLKNNMIAQGRLDLINLEGEIPIITKDERVFLLESARSLTRYFPINTNKTEKQFSYREPAINNFNKEFDIIPVFEKHDWKVVKEDDEKVYLLRNGSLAEHSGYYFKESKVFFCFSTSTEFKPEKPYNNFQVLQLLEGKNDYKTTLRLLSDYGYAVAEKQKNNKISADDIAGYLNGQGVRYDTLIQDLTLNGDIIEELEYNTLFIDLKKHFDKELPRTRFEEVIKSNYIQTTNPLADFIEKYKDRKPKGTFEKWLDCMVLKNKNIDKTILLKYIKKWYVGIIAQALGYQFPNEYFLMVISTEQGIGKTTLLRNYTLPKELHSYRKEHALSYDDDFKVLMSQSLLIIDDEMDGRTYESDKSFKSMLSDINLTMRRKYDRRISTLKRRCSFAGSGNNLFVVREEQNRRIIPVELEKIHHDKLAQVDLIDMFIEAYHLLINGFEYSFQMHNKAEFRFLYEDYIQHSDIDLILSEMIELPDDKDDVYQITSLDLVNTLINRYQNFSRRINTVSIGKLMSEKGYNNQRKGKSKTVFYNISKKSKVVDFIYDEMTTWQMNILFHNLQKK
ncbi:VapE domain-containing protein [Draconibacterium orientale]|uniref:VapE domain-containing protein n=1 Tax=Draconibacterium orientale TaxID=1168034 RepID=UPI002A0A2A19|nr:VapE domain-containing protein [Draconibacterium orientale]